MFQWFRNDFDNVINVLFCYVIIVRYDFHSDHNSILEIENKYKFFFAACN